MKNCEKGIYISQQAFEIAGISPKGGLVVTCNDGAIVIKQEDITDVLPDEVKGLLAGLGIPLETARAVLAEDNGFYEQFAMERECCECCKH